MRLKLIIAVLLTLFLTATSAEAVIRYVKGTCSNNITTYNPTTDSCTGGSDRVYSSFINAINGGLTVAGDTIQGSSGTYVGLDGGALTLPIGTAANRITIKGRTGATVTLTPSGSGSVIYWNQPYVTFDNLILDATGTTQGLYAAATNVRIQNCEARDADTGAAPSGITGSNTAHFLEVINCYIHNNGNGDHDHGVYPQSEDVLVQNSRIWNNSGYGIHSYGGNNSRTRVIGNDFRGNGTCPAQGGVCTTFAILVSFGTGALVFNNTISNDNGGIQVDFSCTDCWVFNNSIHQSTANGYAGVLVSASANRTIVKNNAIWHFSGINGVTNNGSNSVLSNNYCNSGGAGCSRTGANPFVDATNGDLSLTPTTTAIDGGSISIGTLPPPLNTAYSVSYNGISADMGAKESFTVISATTVNTSNFDVTVEAAFAPFTPTSGITGWSMTVEAGGGPIPKTITSVVAQSASVYRVSCSGCIAAGNVIKVSLAANTLRDTSAPLLGQPNFTISNFTVTNTLAGGGSTVAVDKTRIRKWSANVASATEGDWLSTVNQAGMTVRNDGAMLAVAWQITANGGVPPTVGFLTDYCAVDTATCTPAIEVSDSDAVNTVRYDNTNTAQAHGSPITATRLSNPEPTFVSGGVVASTQGYPQPALVDNSATEIQAMYYIKAGLPNGRIVCFRPRAASGYALVHNQTACVTIGHPVASAQ